MTAFETAILELARELGWGYSPEAPAYAGQKQAVRSAMLRLVDAAQEIGDPSSGGRCNSACDCPYGLLRKAVEKGTA